MLHAGTPACARQGNTVGWQTLRGYRLLQWCNNLQSPCSGGCFLLCELSADEDCVLQPLHIYYIYCCCP